MHAIEGKRSKPIVLSDEQSEKIKTLLYNEGEAGRRQAGERLRTAQVTELDLSRCDAHVSNLTNVTSLNLSGCDGLTDVSLSHLSDLTYLAVLNLSGCDGLTDVSLSHLSDLTNLAELNLSGCDGLTDVSLSHLSDLTNLASLDLSGCYRLTDASLSHLSDLTNLASLDLNGCFELTEPAVHELREALSSCTVEWKPPEDSSPEDDHCYEYDDEAAAMQVIEVRKAKPVVLSDEQSEEIKTLLCNEDEAGRQQTDEQLQTHQLNLNVIERPQIRSNLDQFHNEDPSNKNWQVVGIDDQNETVAHTDNKDAAYFVDEDWDEVEVEVGDKNHPFQTNKDWEYYFDDLSDFEVISTRKELKQTVQIVGGISRAERALQEAIALGSDYNWSPTDIQILSEIFEKYGWNATKTSIQRELQYGLRPEELILASSLRQIWEDHPEFSASSKWRGGLTWPHALRIVRFYTVLPNDDELEILLIETFEEWKRYNYAGRSSFQNFLYRFSYQLEGNVLAYPESIFSAYRTHHGEPYPESGYSTLKNCIDELDAIEKFK